MNWSRSMIRKRAWRRIGRTGLGPRRQTTIVEPRAPRRIAASTGAVGIGPGPNDQSVDDPGRARLPSARVAQGDRLTALEDRDGLGVGLARPEGMVNRAIGSRPGPFEVGEAARSSRSDRDRRVWWRQPVRDALEVQARPEGRHPRPDVQRQRPRISRCKRGPQPGVPEHRRHERPTDPLPQHVGPDEEVREVAADAGVHPGPECEDLAGSLADQGRRVFDQVAEVGPHDIDRGRRPVIAVGRKETPDGRDILRGCRPDLCLAVHHRSPLWRHGFRRGVAGRV